MENGTHTGAGVLRPMEFAPGPMGFSRSFAAFSQNILDRYAIWEKYPWSDAVIRYLEQEKQEEASGEKEPSSFFVTLKLLKIYMENEQGKEKEAGEAEETGEAKEAGKAKEAERETLTVRIEAELKRLKAGYDIYFGILERLYREGRQMPQDERVRIWELLKREAGRRGAWGNGQKEEGRKPSEQVVKSLALWERGLITPYALGAPAVRLRRMAEGHGRMPDGKALFRKSVERQQREFYTGIVRSHVVREMAGQAEHRLGRELTPSEYQALQDYGDSLDGIRLVSYASRSDARLYQETAALVLRLPADAAGGTGNEARESSSLETNIPEDNAGAVRGAAEEGKPNGEEVSEEMVRLLSELPDFISRAVVQELYAERAGNAIEPAPFRRGPGQGFYADSTGNAEKGTKEPEPYGPGLVYRTESQDSLRLSKLWEQSTGEEKERLLERIPLAVRQAVFLWRETGQEDETFRSEEILQTLRTMEERIEAARRAGIKAPGSVETAASGSAGTAVPGSAGTEASGSVEAAVSKSAGVEQTPLPADAGITEEIGRLLLELPDFISRAAVRELYEEDTRTAGKEGRVPEEGTSKVLKQPPAMPEGYGENLVYRTENQDVLPLAELWKQSGPEERMYLLQRIPQAVRQAALLSEESGRGTGGPRRKEMLEAILERMEAFQASGATGTPRLSAGPGTAEMFRLPANAGTAGALRTPADSGTTDTPRLPADPGTAGTSRLPADSGTAETSRLPADPGIAGTSRLPADSGTAETSRLPADHGIAEEVSRLLLELPEWISRTAAAELYAHGVKNARKGEEPEDGTMKASETQQSVVPEAYGEDLVYRLENQTSLQLSTLWEQSGPEERTHLLERISQAIRQAVLPGEAGGQGTGGPRQKEMLESILERMEAFQASGTVSHPGASGSSGTHRTAGPFRQPAGSGPAEMSRQSADPGSAEPFCQPAGSGTAEPFRQPADPGTAEEVGRLLLELPEWISKTAAAELYAERGENAGRREEPENGAIEASEVQSPGPEGSGENLVYRVEGRDSLQLSTLWEQSTPEERNHLLRRIPGAVEQAAFLWEESRLDPGGPLQEKVLQTIVERLKTTLERMEAFHASGTVPHLEASGSPGIRRGAEMPVPDNRAGSGKQFLEEERYAAPGEQMLLNALTWLVPQTGRPIVTAETTRTEPETFYRIRPQIQREGSVSSFSYPSPWESTIVYAAGAPQPSGVRQKEEGTPAVQELESRITRQEYIIRQERMEMEELQRRMKKQEDKEDTLWQSADMKIASKQGSDLSPDMLARLKEHLRKERIRYGAD